MNTHVHEGEIYMNKEEMINELNEQDEETKEKLAQFLKEGQGHSTAPIEHFTNLGIPLEFLEPMVRREWSNFVQVPKGVTKVAVDCITERPIGYLDRDNKGWKLLLTPKEQEKLYLESDSYYGFTSNRKKQLWLEETEEYEFDEEDWDKYVKEHRLHPKAKYWSHRWSREEYQYDVGLTTVEYSLPVYPTVDTYDDNKPREFEIKDSRGHYLIKYEGMRRVDYININRLQWHLHWSKQKPMTKMAAMVWVRDKLAKSPDLSGIWGSSNIEFRVGNKRRPMKDIAQDKWQESRDEIEWHKKSLESYKERCDAIWIYMRAVRDHPTWDLDELEAPAPWRHEQLEPMGFTDVMWNNNWMTPWVDGISCTRVINALKNLLEIEGESGMLGRGSQARALGGFVLEYLRELGVLGKQEMVCE